MAPRSNVASEPAGQGAEAAAERLVYQELLRDKRTGFPTLPLLIERARERLERREYITILYIDPTWYPKIEDIFGWRKLDDVLRTTADALRQTFGGEETAGDHQLMVAFTGDDHFVVLSEKLAPPDDVEREVKELAGRFETMLEEMAERRHGRQIAALCDISVGITTVDRNPKIRLERRIYRGVRRASRAARHAEKSERTRKIADLQATLRDGAVRMEYQPIITADTEAIYGYEALARGERHELQSPQVMLEVADEANLIWELNRLLRARAIEGIIGDLRDHQRLFLNTDPADFEDPRFREMDAETLGVDDADRIVLEITERIAIEDYPRFKSYMAAFRERGFRFAVDDAGSGYAGLGSIANLDPDYIKLDISLISEIDSNFLKQNLVKTMVRFAEDHGVEVIAEGVERREEFETIRELGVPLVQGFLFHRPQMNGAAA